MLALSGLGSSAGAHGFTFVGAVTLEPGVPQPAVERQIALTLEDTLGNPVAADQVAAAFGEGPSLPFQRLQGTTDGRYTAPIQLPATAGWHRLHLLVRIAEQEWRGSVDVQIGPEAPPVAGQAFALEHQEEAEFSSGYIAVLAVLAALVAWLTWRVLRRPKA